MTDGAPNDRRVKISDCSLLGQLVPRLLGRRQISRGHAKSSSTESRFVFSASHEQQTAFRTEMRFPYTKRSQTQRGWQRLCVGTNVTMLSAQVVHRLGRAAHLM